MSDCSRALKVSELLDHIVDFLEDGISTLKSCSFMSTSWSFSTARHLFSILVINPNRSEDLNDFQFGYAWLKTRRRVVANVTAVFIASSMARWCSEDSVSSFSICCDFIIDVLATYPQLSDLQVVGNPLKTKVHILNFCPLEPPQTPRKLEKLAITCNDFTTDHFRLRDVLRHVEELQSLRFTITASYWSEWFHGGWDPSIVRTKIKSLTIDYTQTQHIKSMCTVLLAILCPSSLASLDIREYRPCLSLSAFNTVIQQCASQIEHFELTFRDCRLRVNRRTGLVCTPPLHFHPC